jgi:sugar-specific transcriptional regulator TrmB
MTTNALKQLFTALELSEKEISIFTTLIKFPSGANIATLSTTSHIARGTLYENLANLAEHGIVHKSKGRGTIYRVATVTELETVLKNNIRKAEDNLDILKNSESELQKLIGSPLVKPKFTFTEGSVGSIHAYFTSLQSKEKLVRFIFPENGIIQLLGRKSLEDYLDQRLRYNITARALVNQKDINKETFLTTKNNELREVRKLPKHHDFTSAIVIYDNCVNFFTVGQETISARIESQEFATTMKSLFDTIWEKSS